MHRLLPLSLAALLSMGPALADVTAEDGGPVIAWFVAEGATVERSRDDWGDPLLEVDHYGRSFQIYFYGCTEGQACDAIQFFSGYGTEGGVRAAQINRWNTENRYLRAYLSDTGSSLVEYDVFLGADGLSDDDFAAVVGQWLRGMDGFEAHIGW